MAENVFFYQDHLFVAAALDNEVKRQGGKVYVYRKSGNAWQQQGTILPVPDSYTDGLFGSAFAAYKDELAIGAAGFDPGGAIFIYKNRAGWEAPELVQTITLPDTAEFNAMGYDIVMNDRWLISSIQNSSDVRKGPFAGNAVQSSIIIFEKKNGRWEYRDYMDFGNSFVLSKSTLLALDLEDDQLVIGNPYSNATGRIDGVVFLAHYDEDAGEWTVPHYLYSAENLAAFGASVELEEDRIFVGAPLKDYEGKRDVGAIYVFRKPSPPVFVNPVEDSLFVPNFISPNDDGKNDRFQVLGTVPVESVSIYDRYGKQLIALDANQEWDGDVPSGVYFFVVRYRNCREEHLAVKGTVSVSR